MRTRRGRESSRVEISSRVDRKSIDRSETSRSSTSILFFGEGGGRTGKEYKRGRGRREECVTVFFFPQLDAGARALRHHVSV
mmetsp:Transcript_6535/g.24024  ORF Transcript_6535/g.24024 Transcript_6535/m.24024 type:complete len:82 (+) Transcript_6535:300-545(+)